MSAKAAPAAVAKNGRSAIAVVEVSFRDWVFEWRGTTAIIGRLVDETEDRLREEIRVRKAAPLATLCPSYLLTFTEPWRLSGNGNETLPLERMQNIEMLARSFLGHASHQPIHCQLTGFAYISQWPEEMRKELLRGIHQVEHCATVARVGLATAMEAQE